MTESSQTCIGTILLAAGPTSEFEMIGTHLSRNGFHIHHVNDVFRTTAALEKGRYEVLLIDALLPGFESLVHHLRKVQNTTATILLVPPGSTETLKETFGTSRVAYLVRPIDRCHLTNYIADRLRLRHLEKENEELRSVSLRETSTPHSVIAGTIDRFAETEMNLKSVEKSYIAAILNRTGWNITHSAKILGIDRVTLYNKIARYNLKRPETR